MMKGSLGRLVALGLSLAWMNVLGCWAIAQAGEVGPPAWTKALIAMVEVRAEGESATHFGAAIIVGLDHDFKWIYLVTAHHVAFPEGKDAVSVLVRFAWNPTKQEEAHVLEKRDQALDLAVLAVADPKYPHSNISKTPLQHLPFQRISFSAYPQLGDPLHTIGQPLGERWFWSLEPDRFRTVEGNEILFETQTLAVGNSGGGLFSENWKLMGMVLSDRPPLGRALHIDRIAERLFTWGYPVAWLMTHPLAWSPKYIAAPTAFKDCDFCPEMVVVRPGKFLMGATSDPFEFMSRIHVRARPVHNVTISNALAVGRFEITRREYEAFVEETSYEADADCHQPDSENLTQTDQHPVVCVNWKDIQAYVNWLSQHTGRQYRLPTEAEWEYVARAGTKSLYWWGNDIDASKTRSAIDEDYALWGPAPVGTYAPNPFGLYDTQGNIFEWTADCWHETYNGAPVDGSAWVDHGDCTRRVLRGGTWDSFSEGLRSASRDVQQAVARDSRVGFRVVATPILRIETGMVYWPHREVRTNMLVVDRKRWPIGTRQPSQEGAPNDKPEN